MSDKFRRAVTSLIFFASFVLASWLTRPWSPHVPIAVWGVEWALFAALLIAWIAWGE